MRKRNGLGFWILLLALGLSMLTGCDMVRQTGEYVGVIGNYWEPRIGPQEVTTDAPIFRGPPVISIYPKNNPAAPLTALFYPLQVTQPTDSPIVLGRALGRIFWQTWSQSSVFPSFVYEEDATWPGLPRALARARALDVDQRRLKRNNQYQHAAGDFRSGGRPASLDYGTRRTHGTPTPPRLHHRPPHPPPPGRTSCLDHDHPGLRSGHERRPVEQQLDGLSGLSLVRTKMPCDARPRTLASALFAHMFTK